MQGLSLRAETYGEFYTPLVRQIRYGYSASMSSRWDCRECGKVTGMLKLGICRYNKGCIDMLLVSFPLYNFPH